MHGQSTNGTSIFIQTILIKHLKISKQHWEIITDVSFFYGDVLTEESIVNMKTWINKQRCSDSSKNHATTLTRIMNTIHPLPGD